MITLMLDNLHWEVLIPDQEYFKIAEDRLFGFGVAIDLHAQEVSLILPM